MLVAEVMNKDVKVVEPSVSVREAARIMNKFRIGSLLVAKDNKLVGIVTERDILSKVVAEDKSSNKTLVDDIMTKTVITISPNTTLEDAASVMTKYKIKKLPVLQNEQIVGIITATDLIAYEHKLIEKIAMLLLIRRPLGAGG